MINVNELRLGNNFIDIQTGFNVEITNINHDGYIRIFGGGSIVGAHISEIKPIKLTEKILFKCGFQEEEGFYYLEELWLELLQDFELRIDGLDFKNNIKYLHELQNLYFSLSKKELIINW